MTRKWKQLIKIGGMQRKECLEERTEISHLSTHHRTLEKEGRSQFGACRREGELEQKSMQLKTGSRESVTLKTGSWQK